MASSGSTYNTRSKGTSKNLTETENDSRSSSNKEGKQQHEEVKQKVEKEQQYMKAAHSETVEQEQQNMPNEDNLQLTELVRLLARKIEIEEQHNRTTKISAESFEKIIPECDGSSIPIKKWFDNFDINATAYELNPKQKYVQARAKMTSVAKLFLETTQITEYDELKTALIEEFAKEYNSAEVHKKLSERVKKNTESFHEYLLHMRKIASLNDIEETSIVRYVVDGLRIKSENKHLLYRCKTYKSLQEEYEIFEHFIKDERSYDGERVNKIGKPQVADKKSLIEKKEHCFNCGSPSHKRRDCRSETKCFKCNKFGHTSKSAKTGQNLLMSWLKKNA